MSTIQVCRISGAILLLVGVHHGVFALEPVRPESIEVLAEVKGFGAEAVNTISIVDKDSKTVLASERHTHGGYANSQSVAKKMFSLGVQMGLAQCDPGNRLSVKQEGDWVWLDVAPVQPAAEEKIETSERKASGKKHKAKKSRE